jgi:hypothetical protein
MDTVQNCDMFVYMYVCKVWAIIYLIIILLCFIAIAKLMHRSNTEL